MRRARCAGCGYPLSVCLCSHIRPVAAPCALHIIQHPSERKQAKATVPLLELSLRPLYLYNSEDETAMLALKRRCLADAANWRLIYPAPGSVALEADRTINTNTRLLFLDGTWKKVYRIFCQHQWLRQLPRRHLAAARPTGDYRRQAPRHDSLSTLEAVAYCLHHLYQVDVGPLYRLQQARMAALINPALYRSARPD